MYVQGSPVKIQTPKHWNCISHSITALLPMLLPSIILPPPLSHNAFFPARKIWHNLNKYFIFSSSLNLHKWRSVFNSSRSVSIQMWLCWTNTTPGKKNCVSCWANAHEMPNHRGLKKGIAGIMLGGSTGGLEEMGLNI
jgi:hypothetical protein